MQEQQSGKEQKPEETTKEDKTTPSFVSPSVGNKLNEFVKESKEDNSNYKSADNESDVGDPPISETHKSKKSTPWKRAEKISAVGIGLSFIALCGALFSIRQTVRSVNLADQSFTRGIIKDSIASINQRKRDSTDSVEKIYNHINDSLSKFSQNKKDSTALALSKQSVQAQINAIKENQRQFKLNNQPFLQATEFKLSIDTTDNGVNVAYKLENIKETPVKMIAQKTYLVIANSDAEYKKFIVEVEKPEGQTSTYLVKGFPMQAKTPKYYFQSHYIPELKNSAYYYLYFAKEIKYMNLADNSLRMFKFVVKMKPVYGNTIYQNNTFEQFIENENFDL